VMPPNTTFQNLAVPSVIDGPPMSMVLRSRYIYITCRSSVNMNALPGGVVAINLVVGWRAAHCGMERQLYG
jgi:hypothetical protein